MQNYIRLFNTVKFLKFSQVFYRVYYLVRRKYQKASNRKFQYSKSSFVTKINLEKSIDTYPSYLGEREFIFLNCSKKFRGKVDWNYGKYGKLWTYNLNYFDFLNQGFNDDYIELMEEFVDNIEMVDAGMDPYPISLRGINWIKFLSIYNINNSKINDSLYGQYYILHDNIEYHLLGNHLLENAFSLLFGAYYFQDDLLYQTSKKILISELEEQILDDGGHFELSPMYHQIILFRLLESINLLQNNMWKNRELLNLLVAKAKVMLGWLKMMTYSDGSIPLLNDSCNNIAPTSRQLFEYAERLKIDPKKKKLNQSGYRKVVTSCYELVIDVGHIGPDYIPGHAHSDTFSFELRKRDKPFIVDTGLSTYEANERRRVERSTYSHNTVQVNNKEQSEVWGAFRVAKRAKVIDLQETSNVIKATHDGYKGEGVFHTREWSFAMDHLIISDTLSSKAEGISRIHFHPNVSDAEIHNSIEIMDNDYTIQEYNFSPEFNKKFKALMIEVKFTKSLVLKIKL